MMRQFLLSVALLLAANTSFAQEKSRVHTDLASRYYQVGQFAVAVGEAQQALQANPQYAPAHTVLALIYAQLKQNDLADTHFNAALASADAQTATDVRNSYAWYLCNSERGEAALVEFATVLRDPLYASMDKALTNTGACAAKMRRSDLALSYLNAAIDSNPKNTAAYIYRAHTFINAARYQEARNDIRQAKILLGNSPEVLWLETRLAHAQPNNDELNRRTNTLLHDYPTSEQANWARAGQYHLF